ncbi:Mur ligase [Clostridia bacterium]|nr:Mur ligase [Clostridia bacterium]
MSYVTGLIFALVSSACVVVTSRFALHVFQLESYQLPGYRRAIYDNWRRAILPGIISAVVNAVVFGALSLTALRITEGLNTELWKDALWLVGGAVVCVAAAAYVTRIFERKPARKPMVFTDRMNRLIAALALTVFALAAVIEVFVRSTVIVLMFPAVSFLFVSLASVIVSPVEHRVNMGFFKDAQRILDERKDLIKIGITGSFGKTSVKFILLSILSQKYETLATPASFNTPMGVTRVVREQLTPKHEAFIAEMGARHAGEIKELCDLIHPRYGILTSVGAQHLETFGSIENVAKTKYELVENLPEDGAIVFADDNGIAKSLFGKTTKPKAYLVGSFDHKLGAVANNVVTGTYGSKFDMTLPDGETVSCETKLLGAHNITNILLAATLAHHIGLSAEEIKNGVSKTEPVEHRLQLISTGGATVIDDAYNANPTGAAAALSVLAKFPKRRIIVTPGLVELGEEQDRHNKEFGVMMKDSVDVAILVGATNEKAIREGLTGSGFPSEHIHSVTDLDAALATLAELALTANDTILFENDLPDNYRQ